MGLSERLIPLIPNGKVIVAESGIDSHDTIVDLSRVGADAFLIGEHFMRQETLEDAVRSIKYGKTIKCKSFIYIYLYFYLFNNN